MLGILHIHSFKVLADTVKGFIADIIAVWLDECAKELHTLTHIAHMYNPRAPVVGSLELPRLIHVNYIEICGRFSVAFHF